MKEQANITTIVVMHAIDVSEKCEDKKYNRLQEHIMSNFIRKEAQV